MIYCLFGSDEFGLQARIQELRLALGESVSADYLDAGKCSVGDITQALDTQSFMMTDKFIVLHNLWTEGTPELQDMLVNRLAQQAADDQTTLVLTDLKGPAKTNKLGKALAKYPWEKYVPLTPGQISLWLQQHCQARGLKITSSAREYLLTNFGQDRWRLQSELEKLIDFSAGQTIDKLMAQELTVPVLSDNIFQMIDALANKNLSEANKLINIQLALGMMETELLTMMAYQFRNILWVKSLQDQKLASAQIIERTKLHPFVVQKSLAFAKGFSFTQLQRIFYLLQRVDLAMKSGQTPPKVGLDILAAQIVSC